MRNRRDLDVSGEFWPRVSPPPLARSLGGSAAAVTGAGFVAELGLFVLSGWTRSTVACSLEVDRHQAASGCGGVGGFDSTAIPTTDPTASLSGLLWNRA